MVVAEGTHEEGTGVNDVWNANEKRSELTGFSGLDTYRYIIRVITKTQIIYSYQRNSNSN